jgi:hypothetical protein
MVGALGDTRQPLLTQRRGQAQQKKDDSPLNAAKVRKAIKDGVGYLKRSQNDGGTWNSVQSKGDTTALCTLAMLIAGESTNDPAVKAGLDAIRQFKATATYFVSLRIMAFAAADPQGKKYREDIKRDVEWLMKIQSHNGGWSYNASKNRGDGSNTQFAILALHEASRIGVRVPEREWKEMEKYWLESIEKKSGGFAYYPGSSGPRGSMTCAGISSWIIIQENLADPLAKINGDFAKCCSQDKGMEVVDNAIAWLTRFYTVEKNPGLSGGTVLYYLYGLERAGRLSGRRFIGPNDWYRDGAKRLLFIQSEEGWWKTRNGHGEREPAVGTALALLFLAKGKRPVAIGKYDHGAKDFDLHPKGVHFLTRRLETEWGLKLNWQTVRAEQSTVDDLLEAPVLFMSGKDAISLTEKQKEKLKLYLENGGFLFAEACGGDGCGNAEVYDQAFKQLMIDIFPDSELELLDSAHPIWGSHYDLIRNPERPLFGLQACCRTSVVYCPSNLSCYWALDRAAIFDHTLISTNLKKRVEYCSRIGVNVVAYATNRQLKEKGETPTLRGEQKELLAERALVFPKLSHGGGADDAPNAWRIVLQDTQRLGLELQMNKRMIAPTSQNLRNHPFVFMHGRRKFSFNSTEREAIRKHLETGGFIFADSICASEAFTNSFRKEMKAIMGRDLRPIDPGHEIWTDGRFGRQIRNVTLRTKIEGQKTFREQNGPPRLEGIEVDGRLAVVFSPVDLSCALENSAVSQCTGYTRDDAIKIGTNVIMYSMLSEKR